MFIYFTVKVKLLGYYWVLKKAIATILFSNIHYITIIDASAPLAEDDPDDRLVPQLIEKVAVDRLEVLLTDFYDPFSSQETNKSIAAIQALLIYEPGKHVGALPIQPLFSQYLCALLS